MSTEQIVAFLIQERDRLNKAIQALRGESASKQGPSIERSSVRSPETKAPRKPMSAATRKKMAAAQQKRWAAKKAD